jgi:hypothetical protein
VREATIRVPHPEEALLCTQGPGARPDPDGRGGTAGAGRKAALPEKLKRSQMSRVATKRKMDAITVVASMAQAWRCPGRGGRFMTSSHVSPWHKRLERGV